MCGLVDEHIKKLLGARYPNAGVMIDQMVFGDFAYVSAGKRGLSTDDVKTIVNLVQGATEWTIKHVNYRFGKEFTADMITFCRERPQ